MLNLPYDQIWPLFLLWGGFLLELSFRKSGLLLVIGWVEHGQKNMASRSRLVPMYGQMCKDNLKFMIYRRIIGTQAVFLIFNPEGCGTGSIHGVSTKQSNLTWYENKPRFLQKLIIYAIFFENSEVNFTSSFQKQLAIDPWNECKHL